MDWHTPLFPDLYPKLTDPLWFHVDKAIDDDAELAQLEHEYSLYLTSIGQKNCDIIPMGKSGTEVQDEEEDDDEDDDNEDDDTDTHDDDEDEDMEMEASYN